MPDSNALPQPRLGWLALFQLLITALVVIMARRTDAMFAPPLLEGELGRLNDVSTAGAATRPAPIIPDPADGASQLPA